MGTGGTSGPAGCEVGSWPPRTGLPPADGLRRKVFFSILTQGFEQRPQALVEIGAQELARFAGGEKRGVAPFGHQAARQGVEAGRLPHLARRVDDEIVLLVDQVTDTRQPAFGRQHVVPGWVTRTRGIESSRHAGS